MTERKAGSHQDGKRTRNDPSGKEMLSQEKESHSRAVELELLRHAPLQQLPSHPHVDYEKYQQQTYSKHKNELLQDSFK